MSEIVSNIEGNGFIIEETVVYNKGGDTTELDMNPEKFAIELDTDTYIENDVPSKNSIEIFDLN